MNICGSKIIIKLNHSGQKQTISLAFITLHHDFVFTVIIEYLPYIQTYTKTSSMFGPDFSFFNINSDTQKLREASPVAELILSLQSTVEKVEVFPNNRH